MGSCRACGAPIVYATVGNARGDSPRPMPLDPAPRPGGNVAVYRDAAGRLTGRVLGKGEEPYGYERLHVHHDVTCPAASPALAAASKTAAGQPGLFRWPPGRDST